MSNPSWSGRTFVPACMKMFPMLKRQCPNLVNTMYCILIINNGPKLFYNKACAMDLSLNTNKLPLVPRIALQFKPHTKNIKMVDYLLYSITFCTCTCYFSPQILKWKFPHTQDQRMLRPQNFLLSIHKPEEIWKYLKAH